jgi:hypothetical protein
MTEKEKLLVTYLTNSAEALLELHKSGFSFVDESFIWQVLIDNFEYWNVPSKVLFHNLTKNEIILHLKNYIQNNGIIIESILFDDSIVPHEYDNEIIKAEIKDDGEIWTIHKNDKDTFPSNPHAHNYDKHYKLHLGNGKLYRKKNCIGSINKKNLLILRQKISENIKNIKLPKYEKN